MIQSQQGKSHGDVLVNIQDVVFSRGDRQILKGITLPIHRGKVVAIMGGSGSGKTTLLNLIGGRIKPERGVLTVDGVSVPNLKTNELFELRKRMGMLFQSGALLTDLSVF